MPRRIFAAIVLLVFPQVARATILTNSRPGIAQMAGYWEVDSVQVSSLVDSNYPTFTTTWEYMQPSTGNTSTDGDEHLNMCVSSTGTGATGNNAGTESPLVAEIINAAGSLLPSGNTHAKSRGIFRYYHEHANEVKYEIHPITERDTWNTSSNAFVFANDYHNTIRPVMDGTNKALSTYTDLVQGNNQNVTATVSNDNVHVMITFPTGSGVDLVNYVQYDGQVVQTLTSDSISPFITFHATNCPKGLISGARVMRCRIITNTVAATVAASLGSNQTVTVNVLNRVDMLGISNVVASLGAGQSMTFTQPIEWITCGLTNIGPNVPPTANFSGTPTSGTSPLIVTFGDTSAGNITNRFWDFGDSGTTTITTNTVSHTYAAGTYNVKLIASGPGGSSTNTKSSYIVVTSGTPPPVVLSVTPSCGSTNGGTAITISGSNFVSGAAVTIGGTAANSVVFVDGLTLTATTPASTAGAKNVAVTNPSAQSGTLTNGFSYVAPPSPSNNGPICSGQTLNLFANTTAPSYSWTGPNSFSSSLQNPTIPNATTAATGTYNLTVTSNGCTSAAGSTAAVVKQTPATPAPSNNGPICSGHTLNLSANTTADSYSWAGPNSFSSSLQNPSIPNATTAATGTYSLTVTSNGCTSAAGSTAATVNETPATPAPSNNGPICSGQTLNLFANTSADSYSWIGPNSFSSSLQNPSIPNVTTAATGTYNLTVTSNGCTSATGSTAATVNETPASPSAPTITTPNAGFCINAVNVGVFTVSGTADTNAEVKIFANTVLIGASSSDGGGNWSTNLNFTALGDGPLSLTATVTNECSGSSAPSPAVSGAKDATIPSFGGLDAATPAIESATLTWSAAGDSNAVTYQVFQATTSGAENFGVPTLTTNVLSAFIAPIYPGSNSAITYFFVVRAVDGCGNTDTNTVEKSLQPLLDPNRDQDGDGIPNGYEQVHGLNPFDATDATIDSDGDGMSNLQEFLDGTDPNDSASIMRITSVVASGGNVAVTWVTAMGHTNVVQATSGQPDGSYTTNFSDLSDLIIMDPGSGAFTTNYTDSGGATNLPARYYRIRLQP